jgi:hypothetical protein
MTGDDALVVTAKTQAEPHVNRSSILHIYVLRVSPKKKIYSIIVSFSSSSYSTLKGEDIN